MRISRVLLLLFAVAAGLYFVPRLLVLKPMEQELYNEYVTQKLPKIKQVINEALSSRDGVCVYEGPFPFNSRDIFKPDPWTSYDPKIHRSGCDRCEDLYQAGLLTKSIEDDKGQVPNARFELSDFGISVYTEEPPHPSFGKRQPRFCFGKTVLLKIEQAQPVPSSAGGAEVDIKYVAEVFNPHPFLFDPRSKPLRLTVPQNSKPAVYPARAVTIYLHADGNAELAEAHRPRVREAPSYVMPQETPKARPVPVDER